MAARIADGIEFNINVQNTPQLTTQEKEEMMRLLSQQPHIVILGAGATMATIPNGDKNGKKCSAMDNFLKEMGLEELDKKIKQINLKAPTNLEELYSEMLEFPEYTDLRKEVEDEIDRVMSEFCIPDYPTLYDYLILSLKEKDCIATFNWDPLLVQAYKRSLKFTSNLPQIFFLHGNVAIRYCEKCKEYTYETEYCENCGEQLHKSPLLYPVTQKNYTENEFIKGQWEAFLSALENVGMLTVWGYSAPVSDEEAKDLMFIAFTTLSQRFNQIELINKSPENILKNAWNDFGKENNFRFRICKEFEDSSIAEYPRRSIEGYVNRIIWGNWTSSPTSLKGKSDEERINILKRLINEEI